jgi:CPA2 family monovalent cation:H+ antiporter-2
LVFKKRFTTQNALAGSFLASTTITLVLPTLQVARNLNAITSQQSGAFILAAILTCVLSPILFNQFYYPEKEDLVKTKVTFVGTNLLTMPVAQQLSKGWYDIRMVTDRPKNYRTYNSEIDNIQLLDRLDEPTLVDNGIFDTDILVLGYSDYELNFTMAQQAVQHQVPRIVARFESHDIAEDRYEILAQQGVEIFNSYNVNISLLRGMIESPSSLKILTDTEAGLYEVTVHNRRFTGIALRQLPFIDLITVSRIYRNGKYVPPHGDTLIEPNDHLVFTGDKDVVKDLRQQLSRKN